MQAKFIAGLLLLVLVAVASTASLDHSKFLSSLKKSATINFYKQYYVYLQAILNEGIPALGVPPLDPVRTNIGIGISQRHNPQFPDYTEMSVAINGLNFSHFSEFTIDVAELDLDQLLATLSLHQDLVDISSNVVNAVAVNTEGRILTCNCTYFQSPVTDITFSSTKQLQVNGTILQVEQFELDYAASNVSLNGPIGCTGDLEIMDYFQYLLLAAMQIFEYEVIPVELELLAQQVTIVLNDIFALRNITYEDGSTSSDHFSSHHDQNQLQDKLAGVDLAKLGESIRRSVTKDVHTYEKSSNNPNDSPIKITWTY